MQVLLEIVCLLLLARVIEPVYGSTEFLKLILVVDFGASITTFIFAYVVFLSVPVGHKGKTL
jgi:hypothetical protein